MKLQFWGLEVCCIPDQKVPSPAVITQMSSHWMPRVTHQDDHSLVDVLLQVLVSGTKSNPVWKTQSERFYRTMQKIKIHNAVQQ